MVDLHRILTGQAVTRKELIVGGCVVAVWFLMDFAQWVDWLWGKFH